MSQPPARPSRDRDGPAASPSRPAVSFASSADVRAVVEAWNAATLAYVRGCLVRARHAPAEVRARLVEPCRVLFGVGWPFLRAMLADDGRLSDARTLDDERARVAELMDAKPQPSLGPAGEASALLDSLEATLSAVVAHPTPTESPDLVGLLVAVDPRWPDYVAVLRAAGLPSLADRAAALATEVRALLASPPAP